MVPSIAAWKCWSKDTDGSVDYKTRFSKLLSLLRFARVPRAYTRGRSAAPMSPPWRTRAAFRQAPSQVSSIRPTNFHSGRHVTASSRSLQDNAPRHGRERRERRCRSADCHSLASARCGGADRAVQSMVRRRSDRRTISTVRGRIWLRRGCGIAGCMPSTINSLI